MTTSPLGLHVIIEREFITAGQYQLPIASIHGGYVAIAHMLGLGWFYAVRRGLALEASVRTLALFALCALPIQLVAVFTASIALAAGSPDTAAMLLESASWLLPLVVVVWLCERRTAAPQVTAA